ncbi:MAG: hypothetical protein HZA49_05850 [Planctomycetes bacterium]|nr:hypothetical protein [Planctomycetota bacterium]
MSKYRVVIFVFLVVLVLVIATKGCFKREKPSPQSGSSAQPGAFQTILPVDGVINVDVFSAPVPVAWTASSNTDSYILEVAKDDDFTPANMVYSATLGPNTTSHSVTFGTLWGGVWYYWRVTAVNAFGTTVSSDAPSCFYTSVGGIIPGAFNLATPSDNDSGLDLTPELDWTNAPKESKYIVYLDNDSNFSSPIYTDTTRPGELGIQIPSSAGLTETSRYYWKVDAYNPFGTRSSSIYSFVTGPISSYTITPTATTITAGNGITMTITAYNSINAIVSSHIPFTLTMNSGAGLTYYTNNALTVVNPTGTYTMTNGTATVYVRITSAGSTTITATDRAGRTKSCAPFTVNTGPIATVTVSGPSSITSGVESSSYTAASYDTYNNPVADTYTCTKANGTGSANLSVDKLTGILAGTVTITATSNTAPAKAGGQTVTILPGTIATVTVAGSDPITSGIQSSSYTAVSRDINNNTVTDTFNWSNSNNTGTATRSVDKLTGVLAGAVTITATSVSAPTKAGGKTVTVIPGAVNIVTVAGSNSITSGIESSSYTAVSKDINNNTVSDTFTWSNSNGTGTATRNVDKLTGVLVGTVTITATSISAPSKSGGQTVTVIPGVVNTVTVAGSDPITSGIQSSSYTAVSRDINNNTVTDTFNWSNSNGTGTATRSVDKLTGVLSGTVTITATSVAAPSKSGGKTVTVIPGAINTVTVSGPDPITSGVESSSYTAVSYDTAGNFVTDTFNWSNSNNTGTATRNIDKLTGVLSGTVTITATSVAAPSKTGGQTVTVVPGAVNTVTVSGSNPITSGIESTSYSAVSRDINNNIVPDTYTWSKANGTGTANLNVDKLIGVISGTVIITATSTSAPTKSGGQIVTVVPGTVNSVTVSGSTPITSGIESASYTAVSRDINNNIVSDTYTWSNSNGTGTATRSVDKLTGVLVGTVTITATSVAIPTKSGGQTVTVVPGTVNSVTVSGSDPITSGIQSSSYTAVSRDINNNTVTDTFNWSNSNNTGTATRSVDKLTGVLSGTVTITATSVSAPAKSGGKTVTVIPGAVNTVIVSGPDPITSGMESSSYTAISRDINNNTVSDTYNWTKANGTGTAAINGAQLTGALAGTVTITATSVSAPAKSGGKTVTVIPGAVNTVIVSGPDPITSGVESSSYSAVSYDAAGNTVGADAHNWSYNNGTGTATRNIDKLTGVLSGTVTITATSVAAPSKAGGKTVTVIPGTVNTVIVSGPDPITSAVESSSYTAVSYDTAGNFVTDTFNWSNSNGTGTATRNIDKLTGVLSGTVTITATSVAAPSKAGGKTVTVIPGAIVTVTVSGSDPITSAVETASYIATSRDVAGNTVTDTFNWSNFNGTGTATRNIDKLTGVLSGTVTITATSISAPAKSGGKTVTVVPGAIANYSVIPASFSTVTGTNQTATVTARDANNNTVTTDSSTVITMTTTVVTATPTVLFYTNSGYTVQTVTYTLTSGIATIYYRATHDGTPPDGFILRATDANSKTGASGTITIPVSGPATRLVFTVQPTNTAAGSPFIPTVQVAVQDDYGNTVPNATNTITITSDAGVTLAVITQTNAVNGIAAFTGLTVGGISATGYTLTATSAGLTSTTSTAFAISPGAANNLTFIAQPQTITAGNTWAALTVRVWDAYTNPVSGISVAITTTNGAFIYGTLSQNSDSNGIATFGPLSMTLAATGYALSATYNTLFTTSTGFNVTPAVANTLEFVQQPTTTTAGASITPAVTVRCRDQYNNLVPNVSVWMIVVGGSPTLYGTSPMTTDANGLATFGDLSIQPAGVGYRLRASLTAP